MYRFHQERIMVWAVVTQSSVEVRSGPGRQFGVGFTVPEGRLIVVLTQMISLKEDHSSVERWVEIGVPSEGLKGWVQQDFITKI